MDWKIYHIDLKIIVFVLLLTVVNYLIKSAAPTANLNTQENFVFVCG
jgi:hypothetical protein